MMHLAGNVELTASRAAALLKSLAGQLRSITNYLPKAELEMSHALDMDKEAYALGEQLHMQAHGLLVSMETLQLDAIEAEGAR